MVKEMNPMPFKLLIPVGKNYPVPPSPMQLEADPTYVAKLVSAANRAGLQGLKVESFEATITKQGVLIQFKYKEKK